MPAPEARSIVDTVVAVTGASSGIGRATARALLEQGAKVAVTARRADRLNELVKESDEDRIVAVPGDVRSAADNQRLVDTAVQRFGRLDSLVAAAGIGMYGGIMDHTDAELAEMVETNVTGTVWSVRAAVPAMLAAGGGDIVVISSVAGLRGGANEAVYAATKFAQVGLAGAIDRELRKKGIRVCTICPAAVETEFAIGKGRTAGDAWLADVMRPEDVAAAVLTVLTQPRRLRTQIWSLWSAAEGS